jgi:nucleotide-binding universal stress UspA family protein
LDVFGIAYTDWATHFTEEAKKEIDAVAANIAGAAVTTEVLVGNVPQTIVAAAETNHADLIAMGTHGRGAVMHLVMGNVAERVVRTASCPVLTVREQRKHDA